MGANKPAPEYLLGSSNDEHERLIYQAERIAPITEGFFREAGIGPGQRILDVGAGVGDVSLLLARMVGASGEVVGIERDPRSIARARSRIGQAGLENVVLVEGEIDKASFSGSFDGVVGRYILQFLPDPVASLRALADRVRPGGVIAFQEPSWAPFTLLSAHLPLWSAGVKLITEASRLSGVHMEIGLELNRIFQEAGLPAPHMRMQIELGYEAQFTRWVSDVLRTIRPQVEKFHLSTAVLGDLETLEARIQAEVANSNTVVPWLPIVGAWCRKPA